MISSENDPRKRILIIDDEPDIREFISYNLQKKGYLVFSAFNGSTGYESALKHQPHLILLDVLMPVMNGYETCIQMRKNELLQKTKIVFLSALSESHVREIGLQLNIDGYISKPIRIDALVKRIDRLIQQVS
jgi:two-component system, OmpR family, alkaline phosphatase synthesis response regulator PhoP